MVVKKKAINRGNSSQKHRSDIYEYDYAEVRHENNQYEKSCLSVIVLFVRLQ